VNLLKRQSKHPKILRQLRLLLLPLLVILALPAHETARADIGPDVVAGYGGLHPFTDQPTQVQMVYERVEMELKDIPPPNKGSNSPYYVVDTVAWFVMHNQGAQEESMQVIFPLQDLNWCMVDTAPRDSWARFIIMKQSFQANVDGVNVPISTIETAHPYKDLNEFCAKYSMPWAAFNVIFPAGKDVLIRIGYQMVESSSDVIHSFQYTLETGAAWKGPIGTAYIVVRFPYLATPETILGYTTPGYQILYNEIFWSYRDFEPTYDNNMTFAFVSPEQWQRIQDKRDQIRQDRSDVDAWLELADLYETVAYIGKAEVRDAGYRQKVYNTYEQAIAANPNSADLYAGYASFLSTDCCYYSFVDGINTEDLNRILPLVDKALKLDPSNEVALNVLSILESDSVGFTYDRPVTFTPSITPTPTETTTSTRTPVPSVTRTPTVTPTPRTPRPTRTGTHAPTLPPTSTYTPPPTKLPTITISSAISTETQAPSFATPTRPAATEMPVPPVVKKSGIQVPALAIVFILAALFIIPVIAISIVKRKR
jgi:hypothetical protein